MHPLSCTRTTDMMVIAYNMIYIQLIEMLASMRMVHYMHVYQLMMPYSVPRRNRSPDLAIEYMSIVDIVAYNNNQSTSHVAMQPCSHAYASMAQLINQTRIASIYNR